MCSSVARCILSLKSAVLPIGIPVGRGINSVSKSAWSSRGQLSTWNNKAAFISFSKNSRSSFFYCTTAAEKAAATGESHPPPPPDSAELKRLNDLLEEERKKATEFQDKYMRSLAETQNTITRMRKQVDDAKVFGIQNLVKDLLEFSDVLQSALESIPKEEVTESNVHLKNLHIGLTMVSSSLQKVFKKYGVETVDPLGEKFNPNFHEALFQQEVENKSAGTIVAVSKVGFKLSDRVIRPALVGVAK